MATNPPLTDPQQRFLASLTEHGLQLGLRSPEDLIRHFAPRVIMEALRDDAELRATLLADTIGVKRKVGLRKSPESAGEDLQIALDEGETDAASIVAIFTADDRARYLDATELWIYATESEFWMIARDTESWPAARDHVAFVLESGLANELISARDVIEGVTLARLVQYLPPGRVEELLAASLRQARIEKPFSENEMLGVIPPSVLVEHVPLPDLWRELIVPQLAPGSRRTPRSDAAPAAHAPEATDPVKEAGETNAPMSPAPQPRPPSSATLAKIIPRPAMVSRPSVNVQEVEGRKRASRPPRRSVPPGR